MVGDSASPELEWALVATGALLELYVAMLLGLYRDRGEARPCSTQLCAEEELFVVMFRLQLSGVCPWWNQCLSKYRLRMGCAPV